MTIFTRPIYDILIEQVKSGNRTITYGKVVRLLRERHRLSIANQGSSNQLSALASLLMRVSDESGMVIPPLTAIVVSAGGEPKSGVTTFYVQWLSRRLGTPPATVKLVKNLGKVEPPTWITRLAQEEVLNFQHWTRVSSMITDEEWIEARAFRHAAVA